MNSKQNGKDLSQNTVEDTKLVEQAFSERKHEAIRNAFFQNGVYRLNEVTPELLSKIKYEKGIGPLKRKLIDEVLAEENVSFPPIKDPVQIDALFADRKHEAIRNAFFQYNIKLITDIDQENLEKVKNTKGIGKLKREEIDRVLKSAGYKDTWADKIIYPEIIASSPKLREIFKEKKLNVVPLSISAKELFDLLSVSLPDISSHAKKQLSQNLIVDIKEYKNWRKKTQLEPFNLRNVLSAFHLSKTHLAITEEMLTTENFNFIDGEDQELFYELYYLSKLSLEDQMLKYDQIVQNKINEKVRWREIESIRQKLSKDGKYTLAEIGNAIGLTRERVRQIIEKIDSSKTLIAEKLYIPEIITFQYFSAEKIRFEWEVQEETLHILREINSSMVDNELAIISSPCLSIETKEKIRSLKSDLTNNEEFTKEKIFDKIAIILGRDLDSFSKKKVVRNIKESFEYSFESYLKLYKAKSKSERMIDTIRHLGLKTFTITTNNIQKLEETYLKDCNEPLFADDISNKDRAIYTMLMRLVGKNEIIYIGNNSFIDFDTNKLPQRLILGIKEYLTKQLETITSIKVSALFKYFENDLKAARIANKYELYYILKYYLNDNFDFGKSNTMTIWQKDTKHLTRENLIIQYVREQNNKCSKNKAMSDLGWESYTVEQAVYASSLLSMHGTTIYYHNFAEETEINGFVEKEIKTQIQEHDRYIFPKLIQKKVKILCSEKGIKFPEDYLNLSFFADLIKYIEPKWKGFPQFLYEKESLTDSEIIQKEMANQVLTRQKVIFFFKEIGFSESSAYQKYLKLKSNYGIVKIGPHRYKTAGSMYLTSSIFKTVEKSLLDILNDQNYIVLKAIDLKELKLPVISDLQWNTDLIAYCVTQATQVRLLPWFTKMETQFKTTPEDPLIVASNSSSWCSIVDLICYTMEGYSGFLSLAEFLKYLKCKNILLNEKLDTMPAILKQTFYIDRQNIVHLKKI